MSAAISIMRHACLTLAGIILYCLAFESSLHAYVDPGSGSMLLQVLLGGFAALAVVVRLCWHRLRELVRRGPRDAPAQPSE